MSKFRVIMILIIIGAFIKPYYVFFTNELDNNLTGVIQKETILLSKNGIKLTEKIVINKCIAKEQIKETGFISVKDKNKDKEVKSNKIYLEHFTQNECKKYYSDKKENDELKSQFFNLLGALVIFYIAIGVSTKKWL